MSGAWYLESRAGCSGGQNQAESKDLSPFAPLGESGLGSGFLRTWGFRRNRVSQEGQAEHRQGTGMEMRTPAGLPEDPPQGLT